MKSKLNLIVICALTIVLMFAGILSHYTRPHLLNDDMQVNERIVSFFRKDYVSLLIGIKEQALESKLIIEVTAIGNHKYVYGDLIQEVFFEKIIKGKIEKEKLHEKMYYIGNGWSEGEGCISSGFTNYLQKGQHYILFAEGIFEDYDKKASVIKANVDMPGLRCLNISSDESYVYESSDEQTKYKNVSKSEFFCNDKETLEKIREIKYDLLKEIGVAERR